MHIKDGGKSLMSILEFFEEKIVEICHNKYDVKKCFFKKVFFFQNIFILGIFPVCSLHSILKKGVCKYHVSLS